MEVAMEEKDDLEMLALVEEELAPQEWLDIWARIAETRNIIDYPCLGGG
jgi:hypothetical protein